MGDLLRRRMMGLAGITEEEEMWKLKIVEVDTDSEYTQLLNEAELDGVQRMTYYVKEESGSSAAGGTYLYYGYADWHGANFAYDFKTGLGVFFVDGYFLAQAYNAKNEPKAIVGLPKQLYLRYANGSLKAGSVIYVFYS